MTQYRHSLGAAAVLTLAAHVLGCSNDDDTGSGEDSGGTAGNSLPQSAGGGTDSGSGTASTGYSTTLTSDQAEKLAESACNAWSTEAEGQPAKIEFVIDISSSMNETASGSTDSKWVTTRAALIEAIVGVTGSGLGANTAAGLLFYPGMYNETVSTTPLASSTDCLNIDSSVPMALLGEKNGTQRTAISNALNAVELGLGTPTHDAYLYALNQVVLGTDVASIAGDPYILLITDGQPTLQTVCYNTDGWLNSESVDPQPIVDEIAGAFTKGVKTFIIGSPGSESARAWLSAAATAGGTAASGCSDSGPTYCHMDMTTAPDFSSALADGLSQVATALTNCKYTIPTTSADGTQVVDPTLISPIITHSDGTAELLGVDSTGACAGEGFRLNSVTELELCPTTCSRLQADSTASLQLMFGCNSDTAGSVIQ